MQGVRLGAYLVKLDEDTGFPLVKSEMVFLGARASDEFTGLDLTELILAGHVIKTAFHMVSIGFRLLADIFIS